MLVGPFPRLNAMLINCYDFEAEVAIHIGSDRILTEILNAS